MSKPTITSTEALGRGLVNGGSAPEVFVAHTTTPSLEEQRFRAVGDDPASRAEIETAEGEVALQNKL